MSPGHCVIPMSDRAQHDVHESGLVRDSGLGWRMALIAILGLGWMVGLVESVFAQSGPLVKRDFAPLPFSDTRLNDCCMVSLDEGWTVGDGGLILSTRDGGKTWNPIPSGVNLTLHAIAMKDKRRGLIVGGTIQLFSKRSQGVVLTTDDGGKTWKRIEQLELPRLIGMQEVAPGHWMAWGDYSPVYGTSLFESIDHGRKWSPVDSNFGHVPSAAWKDRSQGIVIDRLHRVYRVDAVMNMEPLQIGGDIHRPLRAVRYAESGWWLVGAAGQVFHSIDGIRWRSVELPGTAQDRELLDLANLYGSGPNLWLVGNPGQVVWCSRDAGESWKVQKTGQSLPLTAIHGFGDARLLAVGPMARILGTRNSGEAWWTEHQQGERLGLLNIASSSRDAAWEAMIAATWNHAKHSGLLSLSDTRIESRVDILPDFQAREDILRSEIGLSWNETCPGDFTGNPSDPSKAMSQQGISSEESYLVARLRTWRPDVVVISSDVSSSLEGRDQLQKTLMKAIDECRNPNRQVFSVDSGIQLPAWDVKKVFASTEANVSSLTLSSDQLLAGSGRMMSEVLYAVHAFDFPARKRIDFRGRTGVLDLALLKSSSFTDGARRDLFSGFVQDEQTSRKGSLRAEGNFQGIHERLQRDLAIKKLSGVSGPKIVKDRTWERTLDSLIGNRSDRQLSALLFEVADESRRQGYWNRWQACLGRIVRIHPNEGVAEEAWRQLIVYGGSQEVQHAVRTLQHQEIDSVDTAEQHSAVSLGSVAPASPFDRGVNSGSDSRVELANFQDEPASDSSAYFAVQAMAVEKTWSVVDSRALEWVDKQMRQKNPYIAADPRIQLPQASQKVRQMFEMKEPIVEQPIWVELMGSTSLAGWSQVGKQEVDALKGVQQIGAMMVGRAEARPRLDGVMDEECWRGAKTILMSDPWEPSRADSSARVLFDSEFLYIGLLVPCENKSGAARATDTKRTYDAMKSDSDHVEIRLDIDRDYSSWYTFGVDSQGRTTESSGEDLSWNPEWYVAVKSNETDWSVELAIPLAELKSEALRVDECWAAMILRHAPMKGSQHNGRVVSTDFLPQGMRMLHFESPGMILSR